MQKSFALCVLLIVTLFSMTAFAGAAKTAAPSGKAKALASDEFPIGAWNGPPDEFLTLARLREMKDAGFTHMIPTWGHRSPDYNRKALELGSQVGIKVYVIDDRAKSWVSDPAAKASWDAIIAEYWKHPALAGYYLAD